MKNTKKLLASVIAASAASVAGVANADIELGEGLAVTGFVDMSYVYTDVDGADSTGKTFGVDQVETDFLYSGKDGISARVDIEYGLNEDGSSTTFVEEAFITKDFGNGLSVKGGRFLSYSGWETEEPTGLFQYSGAKAVDFSGLGLDPDVEAFLNAAGYAGSFYGGYQQGVSAYYDTETVDVMFSVVNSPFDPYESDTTQLGIELGVAVTPAEGVTAKAFYITEGDTSLINAWASYETGDLTLAFEFNIADYGDEHEADGMLLMANYAFTDKAAVTVRFHDYSKEIESTTYFENSGITIAPSYALADNLLIVTELRQEEDVILDGEGVDITTVAVEALFTF